MSESERAYQCYGDVWIGDLLWASAKTTVGAAVQRRAWAAEMMGLPALAGASSETDGGAASPAPGGAQPNPPTGDVDELRRPLGSRAAKTRAATESFAYGVVSQQRNEDPSRARDWLDAAPPLPEVNDAQLTARPAFEPLFWPQTIRTLLSTALSTCRDEGDIDLDRILEQATRLRPVNILPRRPLATLRFGIQLLVDRGPGMWPFHGDQQRLHRDILAVVGSDRVETLYFADCPTRGCGPGNPGTWKVYEPPSAGTPAVLLTDLGLARRRRPEIGAPEDEWLSFAKRLQGAECPVLALLPYGPDRWPARLQRSFSMLPWDRSTSVSLVRRLIGHGLEVTGSA